MYIQDLLKSIWQFYYQGFNSMRLGKRLWFIIVIKLVVIFGVVKWLFFPNYLKTNFTTDEQRANHVLEQLISHKGKIDGE